MEAKYYEEIVAIKVNGNLLEINEDSIFIAHGETIFSMRASGTVIIYNNVDEVHVTLKSIELLEPFKVQSFEVNGSPYVSDHTGQCYHMNLGPWSLGFWISYDGSVNFKKAATNVKK